MGQSLGSYTDVTYLQKIDMRLVEYMVLEEHSAALFAYYPIPIYGPRDKPCFGIIPLSILRELILRHLESSRQAAPICLLSAYGTRTPDTRGVLLVLRLCRVQGYEEINCFEGAVHDDPLTGSVYVPHDDKPRLQWWLNVCARVSDLLAKRKDTQTTAESN